MKPAEIRTLRESFGMNQTEFGQLMNVHWTTVSGWERDVTPPSAYHEQMLQQFKKAAKLKENTDIIKGALIGAGALVALAILLEHLIPKK
jgi:DNA-binding XRE family transcriptional regulator